MESASKKIINLVVMVVVTMCLVSSAFAVPSVEERRIINRKISKEFAGYLVGYQQSGCIGKGQPCGLFDPCCSNLYCTSFLQGACICVGLNGVCGYLNPCCEGLSCTGFTSGQCIKVV